MTLIDLWHKAQEPLKEQVGPTGYDTWLASLKALHKDADTLLLQAPDEFFKNWIIEHYAPTIERCLKQEAGRGVAVEFEVNASPLPSPTNPKSEPMEKPFDQTPARPAHLNPRFLFENFVVGASNRFAYAAAQAVAEAPAKMYNPFFIYGPVGLGKTHLLQAITHDISRKHPALKACYITSEQFTNELINAIRHRCGENFRQKYRTIDVLLIDDIHFIAGKESTQEEFFHTFNTLHDHRKQIIICSDRPPKEIAHLEDRLVSRFNWGLIADIQPPDYETRAAILHKKLELESVKVPEDVVTFIASEIKTNIRELEGALLRVVAYAILEEKPVNLAVAKTVLKHMVKEMVKTISVDMVQKEVAEFFNLTLYDLKNKSRHKNVVVPRQVAMYLSRKLTAHSLPEIGAAFGGKDHTTILYAVKKVEEVLLKDEQIRKIVETLKNSLLE
ncbi:MAG: chromosomal replication initiator protein DnaA [Candidatus Omnitrophica bacterium]|nr:chromosomal replication initiator protein DnaA [Candidatus Omnitrophota bacterium]